MALEDNRLIPEKPSEPHYGRYVVALVVFIGLGVTLANTRPSAGLLALVGLLGGVYTLLSIVFGEDRWAEPTRPQLWAYFSVQLALAGVLAAILAGEGIYSMQWLMLMPLIAQGRIFLQPWGAALIVLASLSIIAAHIHALAGWRAVPGAVLGVFTAVIFVLLFTDIARREAIAREKSQSLSQQLLAANTQLADFAVKAEELAAERERSRLAREIHDSVGHYLTVVHVQLEAAKTMLERDPAKCRDALDKAQGLTQQGLDEIRHSVASLRATPLEGRSLQESLGELVARSQQTGLSTHLEVLGDARSLGSKADLALYRTLQEGLTNARKHAEAESVDVSLDYRHRDTVRLEIRDDGVGADEASGGFGLLGVQERIRQLAGQVEIRTAPGHGLTLAVEIPA